MKKRTKEEAAAAMRASRARKKAQPVTPAAVTPRPPRKTVTPVTPVTPCQNCADLRAELSRLKDRIAFFEDQIAKGSRATPTPTAEIAGKINTYGKGHNIGRIPL